MKIYHQITCIVCIAIMASCKTIHSITAKDGSTTKKTTATKKKQPLRFIEGIEVTPGSVITSKHNAKTTKQKKVYTIDTTQLRLSTDSLYANFDLEKADPIQLKFAIILDANVEKMQNIALFQKINEWWGTPYCMGGSTKSCTDCSSFTQTIFKEVYHIDLPRTADEQYRATEQIATENLKEGDLLFFRTQGRRVSHVGIYLTNNKFAHASTSVGVSTSDLNDPYWKGKWIGAGRVVQQARDSN